ncbi:hypothetical protein FQA47_005212 [Oryzias melastigma]|uniref:Secreted protein n=1 Tax=Oryzias melastigma TaxID=30732 RepID=A0A834C9A3_ORYME|nr:hypothetical protein FQA47_005212 [Oryzias melastigma]
MALASLSLSILALALCNFPLCAPSNRHAVYWNSSNLLTIRVMMTLPAVNACTVTCTLQRPAVSERALLQQDPQDHHAFVLPFAGLHSADMFLQL